MGGTRIGGLKVRDINYKKRGRDWYQRIGAIGGKASTTGGFKDRELASRAGRIGGLKSKRGKAV